MRSAPTWCADEGILAPPTRTILFPVPFVSVQVEDVHGWGAYSADSPRSASSIDRALGDGDILVTVRGDLRGPSP